MRDDHGHTEQGWTLAESLDRATLDDVAALCARASSCQAGFVASVEGEEIVVHGSFGMAPFRAPLAGSAFECLVLAPEGTLATDLAAGGCPAPLPAALAEMRYFSGRLLGQGKEASGRWMICVLDPLPRAADAFGTAVLEGGCRVLRCLLESVREIHLRLHRVLSAAPIAIAIFDKRMRYVAHSYEWLHSHGLAAATLIGRCHYEVVPNMPPMWRSIHERCLAGETISNPEDVYDPGDGSKLYMKWAVHPWFEDDGSIGGIVIAFTRVDELVAAREAALNAMAVKSAFLANVSHELRTPIVGIAGVTGLMLGGQLLPEQREFAMHIRRSADSLLRLVNDLLDSSKIEAGKLEFDRIDFDPLTILQETCAEFRRLAVDRGLTLSLLASSRFGGGVAGDPGRLRQVLDNLISNALKFTAQGSISICTDADRARNDGRVELRFEVRDTGIGIPKAALERMFEPFTQADRSTSRRFGGTGLGLSICRHLVERMGGRIGAESVEGGGTVVWFTVLLEKEGGAVEESERPPLPANGAMPSWIGATEPLPRPQRELEGYRVLLADDNRVNQIVASRMLERNGAVVRVVGDGRQALEALSTQRYDVVLMDCQMPELDGYETTRLIRTELQEPMRSVPVIALTAHAMLGDEAACMEAGMDAYLSKPVSVESLSAKIRQYCARKRAPAAREETGAEVQ